MVTAEECADAMYEVVKESAGKKNLKPMDLTKAMTEKYGEACDKATCKQAIRILIDSGKCIYSYAGGSFIVLNPNAPSS